MWRWVFIVFGLLHAVLAQANQYGISGHSVSGCAGSGCHSSVSSSSYTAAITNSTGGTPGTQVLAGSQITYAFRINNIPESISHDDHDDHDDYGGFDLSVTGGALSETGSTTQIKSGDVTHENRTPISGSSLLWTFTWTAPATGGTYTLRGAGFTTDHTSGFMNCFPYFSCILENEVVYATLSILVTHTPLADAGSDQTKVENFQNVELNGTASSDPDGSVVSYQWTQLLGTTVSISNAGLAAATFNAPADVAAAGETLTFQLTVTDNHGLTAQDTVSVVIYDEANTPPVVDAGADFAVDEGVATTLAAATAVDGDGAIRSYVWSQESGPVIQFSDNTVLHPQITLPTLTSDATVVLRLTVTDNIGAADSDTITLSLNNLNTPPQALIRLPACGVLDQANPDCADLNGSERLAGTHVVLSAQLSVDAEGIASYAWSQTAGTAVASPGATTNSSFDFYLPDVDSETLSFQLLITDSDGATDTATVSIVVYRQIHFDTGGGELLFDVDPVAVGTQINEVTPRLVTGGDLGSAGGPVTMPWGVTELVIDLTSAQVDNGNAVRIRLTLSRVRAADEYLYLSLADGSWMNISDGLDFNNLVYDGGWYMPLDNVEWVAPGVLEIHVSDGGTLDLDGEVNGSITFTSGVGRAAQNGASGVLDLSVLLGLVLLLMLAHGVTNWQQRQHQHY